MNQAVDAIKKGNKVTIFCLPNEQSQFEVARRSGAEIKVVKK
jgi:hypothetical protein